MEHQLAGRIRMREPLAIISNHWPYLHIYVDKEESQRKKHTLRAAEHAEVVDVAVEETHWLATIVARTKENVALNSWKVLRTLLHGGNERVMGAIHVQTLNVSRYKSYM